MTRLSRLYLGPLFLCRSASPPEINPPPSVPAYLWLPAADLPQLNLPDNDYAQR
jgi:hypothetical protein